MATADQSLKSAWCLDITEAEIVSDDEILRRFHPVSVEFSLPTQTSDVLNQLGLFQSAPILSCSRPPSSDLDAGEEEIILDCVFFTGGLVWKTCWLPFKTQPGPLSVEYLAVCVHPKGVTRNTIGGTLRGLGVLQIWAVPSSSTSPFGAHCAPVLVGGLAHNGVVTWDINCCPDTDVFLQAVDGAQAGASQRLGLIAMALGDGTIQVVSVPDFGSDANQLLDAFKPKFYRVKPHVEVSLAKSRGSLPSSVAWHPCAPHELLLIGFWDGSAAAIKLIPGTQVTHQILFHVQVDGLGLRKVAWMSTDPTSTDELEKRIFLTAANSGKIKIWNMWDTTAPVVDKLLYRSWITDARWTPNGIIATLEDGSVRQYVLDPYFYAGGVDTVVHVFKGTNGGCVWAVEYNPHLRLIAYCGEDGVIGMTALENCTDSRHRKPHAAWGGLRQEGPSLLMLDAHHFGTDTGLYTGMTMKAPGGSKRGEDAAMGLQSVPNENQALHTLSFSPNGKQVTWLASGGKAGLVRCQRFSAQTYAV